MITEKEQKIVDAVNCLKAGKLFESAGWSVGMMTDNIFYKSELVCTVEEFNQCVKEMSLNKYGQAEFGIYSIHVKELLTKENSDYSYYEKETKMSEEKPVYTQAMKDAGELPSVGMTFNVATGWRVAIAVTSKSVAFVYDRDGEDQTIGVIDIASAKPIDTRTPEQKQVDEVAKVMFGLDKWHHDSRTVAERLQKAGLLAEIK